MHYTNSFFVLPGMCRLDLAAVLMVNKVVYKTSFCVKDSQFAD